MSCHQWCECPKCSTFYDACMNEIPNPHTGTMKNQKSSEQILIESLQEKLKVATTVANELDSLLDVPEWCQDDEWYEKRDKARQALSTINATKGDA